MSSWVEITNPVHGGAGWEFGTCLWSPVTNKGGQKSWELMREPQPGDMVFHLLKENKGEGYFLTGASRVASAVQLINSAPPEPYRWADMAPYYRVPVEAFIRLSAPYSVDKLLFENRDLLEAELHSNPRGQFFEKKASGKLQVSLKYIAKAEGGVERLLVSFFERSNRIPGAIERDSFVPSETTPAYPDYSPPGTVEARVVRRVRDTQLSREAKAKFGFRCAICKYRVELGAGRYYAEAHHLMPLGAGHDGPDTMDNLLVLCPTHHAEFDYGAIAIDPISTRVVHYDCSNPFHGQAVAYELSHLNKIFVEYHYSKIFLGGKHQRLLVQ